MALLIPVMLPVNAFDATVNNTFIFSVPTGGDQVTQNRLTIINQSTGLIVYQQTQTTFAYSHTLAANTLTNGTYYSAYINTFNSGGTMSINSNTIQFYCYTTPTLSFTNLPTGNIINNNSFNFQVTYNQAESELINSYQYILYDAQNVQIATSGVLYVTSPTFPSTILYYTFSGLLNNTSYYVQANCSTVNGTNVSTDLTQINVQYEQPTTFAVMQLSQNCDGGYVTVTSNMTNIKGTSNPSPPIYISGTSVNLTSSGSYVNWGNNQFDFSGDFTLQIWGSNFTTNNNIITLENASMNSIAINYNQGYYQGGSTLQVYCDCIVTNDSLPYYIYSNYIDIPATTDNIQIWLRRINNIYQLNIYNLGT